MLTLLMVLQVAAPPTQRPAQLTRFLEQSIGLDTAQLTAVERGEPVARVLETHDRRDVALFGIITVARTREAFAQAVREFPAALRTPNRTQLGIFYANHYFETAIDLTCAVDRGPGIYLLVLRRFRFDNLPGGILNIRGRAISALRDQLVLDLKRYQTAR